jgi:hypothetical protein
VSEPKARLYAANLKFGRRARARAREHLAHLLDAVDYAVVVGVQEAKNVWLAHLVGLAARAMQRTTSAAVRGSGIVVRGLPSRNFRLFLGGRSAATLPRWIARCAVRVDGHWLPVFSAHPPPKRAGDAAQDRHLEQLKERIDRAEARGHPWAVCIDANRSILEVAKYLGGIAYGEGIVGVIVSRRVIVAGHGIDRYGVHNGLTDHPAPWIDIAGIRPKETR